MKGYLITGASRGLGHALAREALQQGAFVVCVARREPEDLPPGAGGGSAEYRFVGLDLGQTDRLLSQVDRLWDFFAGRQWEGLYLINNAATNQPLDLAEANDVVELTQAIAVNLTAAMLLANSFIRETRGLAPDRRVLNISSGAGRRPFESMSAYCATKAGLDCYTQCVGLEQATKSDPVRIASIAPGIIDTDMQASARAMSAQDFSLRQQFVDYHEKGELAAPDAAAAKLLRILHSDAVRFGDLLNIRDFA